MTSTSPLRKTTAPACHGPAEQAPADAGTPRIALLGSPNSGKSTLFNLLTGAGSTVGNWPGTTVAVGRGRWQVGGTDVEVLDLPGAYSLQARSPDEELTRDLVAADGAAPPSVCVVVTDAAHLTRSLYLVAQLREQPLRVIVALTMVDVVRRRGGRLDPAALPVAIDCPVVVTDPRARQGAAALAAAVSTALDSAVPQPRINRGADDLSRADDRFTWIQSALVAADGTLDDSPTLSDRIDRVLTAPFLGMGAFLAVMWLVFQITTTVAAPLQGALDAFFSGPVSRGGSWLVGALGLGGTWVESLVVDGLIAGVGMLLTFVPLMTIMFALLAVLEDSGYLARAAVVTDRLMRRLGLPGQAFLPLVVGFGCNVPAIAATRILPHARQRLLVTLLVPFTSCSARLTVYLLLAATFFPAHAGTVVFAMYLASLVLVVGVGMLLRRTLWRAMPNEPLVLALPPYQRPTWWVTSTVTWRRLRGFLQTAGGIIVATVIVVWVLQAIPVGATGSFGHVAPRDSVYGAVAQGLAPLFDPAGFGGWEIVSTLFVGFVAKEAVISSWAQTYAVAQPTSVSDPGSLGHHLIDSFTAASGGHAAAAVAAFLVFLLAYTPCVATLAAQKREVGLRWTLAGLVLQLGVAWVLAVVVFQIGRLLT